LKVYPLEKRGNAEQKLPSWLTIYSRSFFSAFPYFPPQAQKTQNILSKMREETKTKTN